MAVVNPPPRHGGHRMVRGAPRGGGHLGSVRRFVARRNTGEIGPDDVFEVPPGHDAWTIGNEPAVVIEWTGFRAWSPPMGGVHDRVLTTLLFTDLVGSTATLVRLGDAAWREALSAHYEAARIELSDSAGTRWKPRATGFWRPFWAQPRRSAVPRRSALSRRERGYESELASMLGRWSTSATGCVVWP